MKKQKVTERCNSKLHNAMNRLFDFYYWDTESILLGRVPKFYTAFAGHSSRTRINARTGIRPDWVLQVTNRMLTVFSTYKNNAVPKVMYDGMVGRFFKNIEKDDKEFSFGINKVGIEANSPYFQWDYDFESGLTQEQIKSRINWDFVRHLKNCGITLHFMFSGSKGFHCFIFADKRLGCYDWMDLFAKIRDRVCLDNTPADKFTYGPNCLRLPCSYHMKTGKLSVFFGCTTKEDNLKYFEEVIQDSISREMIESLDVSMFPVVSRTIKSDENDSIQKEIEIEEHRDTDKVICRQHSTFELPPIRSKYVLEHKRYDEYLSYLNCGIPKNQSQNVIIQSDFCCWVKNIWYSYDKVQEILEEVIAIGITSQFHIDHRKAKLKVVLELLFRNKKEDIKAKEARREALRLDEKLRFEVVKQFQLLFPQYSKTEGRGKMKQEQYQKVLDYMLGAADKFGDVFYLSNRKVAEATGTSQKQASNIMHFFCRNFRVFETVSGRKVKKEGGKFTSTPITYRILPIAPTQMQAITATDWFKAPCELYIDSLEAVDDRKGLPDGWNEVE